MLSPAIVIDGQVAGIWKRTFTKGSVMITPKWFGALSEAQRYDYTQATLRYADFHLLAASSTA